MVKMFPKKFPNKADPARIAERLVYDALESQLSDKFYVYYSVQWEYQSGHFEPTYEGEAEKDIGILVLAGRN